MIVAAKIKSFFAKNKGDSIIWTLVLFIMLFSVLAVYSTGSKLNADHQQSLMFLIKGHVFYLFIGLVCMYFVQNINYRWWNKLSKIGLILGAALFFATLFLGVAEHGAKRSLIVFGIKIQTIHFIELCVIIFFSSWLAKTKDNINDIKHDYIYKLLFVFLVCGLIMSQKTSASIILGTTCFVLLFVSKLKFKYFAATIGILGIIVAIGISILMSDAVNPKSDQSFFKRLGTAKTRLESFNNKDDVHREILTTEAAIASSSLLPRPGESIHSYGVKESYSDYVFAFFVEEYGILFGIVLIVLYLILFYRAMLIAKRINTSFGAYLAVGIGFLITFQALVHICVCSGVLPATGETLPLFSKGGMSIITTSISIGILLNISQEAKKEMEQQKEKTTEGVSYE